mmetsp:Transcript_70419/g.187652  ORF Transcript_70419/g.187652 Transcript_70419/m.187652 type:complete len:209 (+) Transcript_70419:32-658(+)
MSNKTKQASNTKGTGSALNACQRKSDDLDAYFPGQCKAVSPGLRKRRVQTNDITTEPNCVKQAKVKNSEGHVDSPHQQIASNGDLLLLCQKWFDASVSVLNDVLQITSIKERVKYFKQANKDEHNQYLSDMGLFLKMHDIDYDMVAWDEDSQDFGKRDFSEHVEKRTTMLGIYNEIKDIAVGMFGLIAEIEMLPVKDVYARYDISKDD